MKKEEELMILHGVQNSLAMAQFEMVSALNAIEANLGTWSAIDGCRTYGKICRSLGVVEEEITRINNEIKRVKKN
jgi:hypothetical protein